MKNIKKNCFNNPLASPYKYQQKNHTGPPPPYRHAKKKLMPPRNICKRKTLNIRINIIK